MYKVRAEPLSTLSPLSNDKSYVGHILNETVIIHCVASTIHIFATYYSTLRLSSITYRPASIVPSSDMAREMTLTTRTIRAEVACVGPFPSV